MYSVPAGCWMETSKRFCGQICPVFPGSTLSRKVRSKDPMRLQARWTETHLPASGFALELHHLWALVAPSFVRKNARGGLGWLIPVFVRRSDGWPPAFLHMALRSTLPITNQTRGLKQVHGRERWPRRAVAVARQDDKNEVPETGRVGRSAISLQALRTTIRSK